MKGYIYKHTSPSGKSYIGQTIRQDPTKRWRIGGKGYKREVFYKAIQKYGWENFTHEILEEVEAGTKEELVQKLNQLEEDYIIKYSTLFPNGYNLCSVGLNSFVSDETKEKISLKNRGRKLTPSQRENISKGHLGVSSGMKGKVAWNRGIPMADEQKKKLSIIKTGKPLSEEHKEKISDGVKRHYQKLK